MRARMTDAELIDQFVTTGSEQAFARLVERHARWVSAAARRRLRGDAALADDVTQAVFILLARKAKSLRRETVLSAWLFQATRYASLSAQRERQRRQKREERAADLMRQQQHVGGGGDVAVETWTTQLAPELDELVNRLGETERRAVLLRFYEQLTFGEVGARLGVSEEAARKRVDRAVAKLSAMFRRRGIVAPAAALAGAMAAHVTPASAAAATISSAGIASAAVGSGSSATAKGAATMFALAQVKAVAAVAAVVVGVAAVGGGAGVALLADRNLQKAVATNTTMPAALPSPTSPPTVFAGRVLTPDQRPVADATVHAYRESPGYSNEMRIAGSITTDARGAYRLPVADGGSVLGLLLDAPPWALTAAAGLSVEPDVGETALAPPTELEVTVVAPDGSPAAGLRVTPASVRVGTFAMGDGWSAELPIELREKLAATTDASGRARIGRLPRGGAVRLDVIGEVAERFARPGYEDEIMLADAGRTGGRTLRLAAAARVAGRLTFPDGSPAAGARVAAQTTDDSARAGWGTVVTDADGRYRVGRLPAGEYNVIVIIDDTPLATKWTAVARQSIALAQGQESAGVDLQLSTPVEVRGRVVEKQTGRPIAGMAVGAYGPARPRNGGGVHSTLTDARGAYVLRVPPGGQHVYLQSEAPDGLRLPKDNAAVEVTVTADKPASSVDFALPPAPGKPVKGRVVGPDHRGVAGAVVSVENSKNEDFFRTPTTRAAADGSFALRAVPPKSQLRGVGSGGKLRTLAPVRVDGGEQHVEIRLAPAVKVALAGRVVDAATSRPVARAKVSLTVWQGQFGVGSSHATTGDDGRYVIKDLAPDKRYTLSAEAGGYGAAQAEAKVAAGRERIEQPPFALKPARGYVSGRVVDERGRPIADIRVGMVGRDTQSQTTRTDAEGRFEFADVVEGHLVTLSALRDSVRGPDVEAESGTVGVELTWTKAPAK